MTGHTVETDLRKLQAVGFDRALPKPFSIKSLTQVVRDVLDS
jgi:CheY-like chemotaxis protein